MPWVDTTQQSLQDRGRRFNLPPQLGDDPEQIAREVAHHLY